jgi:hypothetical protein
LGGGGHCGGKAWREGPNGRPGTARPTLSTVECEDALQPGEPELSI